MMPQELKTDPALLAALQRALAMPQTPEDVDQQRLSFVMGSLKSTNGITRAQVQEILAQQEGRRVA
jgi:Fic family protein